MICNYQGMLIKGYSYHTASDSGEQDISNPENFSTKKDRSCGLF
jgi:hypothetical protein